MNVPFVISRDAKFGMGYIKVVEVDHDYCTKKKKSNKVGNVVK